MLPIRLGSFLTNEEISKNKYEYNKPLIRLCCMAIFVLTAASCAVMGAAVGYARYTAPKPIVAEAEYAVAQKQAAGINKSLAVVREVRSSDLDVCSIVSKITDAVVSSDIAVTDISINEDKINIKGTSSNIDKANIFVDSLDFDKKKYVKALSNIASNSSEHISGMEFTVTISPAPSPKKGGNK